MSEADIQFDLDRRKPGTSRHVTQRREADQVEILSGVFEGKTTGTPIALLIRNTDQRSKDYGNIATGSAPDMPITPTGTNTVHATIAAAVEVPLAKPLPALQPEQLQKMAERKFGTEITAYVTQVGEKKSSLKATNIFPKILFLPPTKSQIEDLENYMDSVRKSLDSVGAKLHIEAANVPVGLGEPVLTASMQKLPTP